MTEAAPDDRRQMTDDSSTICINSCGVFAFPRSVHTDPKPERHQRIAASAQPTHRNCRLSSVNCERSAEERGGRVDSISFGAVA